MDLETQKAKQGVMNLAHSNLRDVNKNEFTVCLHFFINNKEILDKIERFFVEDSNDNGWKYSRDYDKDLNPDLHIGTFKRININDNMSITHAELVALLVKPGSQIKNEITAEECHLIHMTMGICGEAGELLDAIKKNVIYRKKIDFENVLEELGDLEFYLEGLRQLLGIRRQETLDHNIAKLKKRYDGLQYSNESAIERADKMG